MIEAPPERLKRVQKRISILIQRVEIPNYVYSPVPGRSYVDNAKSHQGASVFRLLDVEDFFPSCTSKRVYWFFNKKLQCDPDVSGLLTNITTRSAHLPQGSPSSPILAYWAYCEMWDEINELCLNERLRFTLYVDDITISGEKIYEATIWKLKKILYKYGHAFKRNKERAILGTKAEITGVILNGKKLLIPNRQHKKAHSLRGIVNSNADADQKQSALRSLQGLKSQKKFVEKNSN